MSSHEAEQRNPKELVLIKKAEQLVVRKQFSSISELKSAVYASLIRYLEEKEYIRTSPFDATLNSTAQISDLYSKQFGFRLQMQVNLHTSTERF